MTQVIDQFIRSEKQHVKQLLCVSLSLYILAQSSHYLRNKAYCKLVALLLRQEFNFYQKRRMMSSNSDITYNVMDSKAGCWVTGLSTVNGALTVTKTKRK